MKTTRRTINSFLKKKKIENKEITRYKGEFWLLHICQNNVPVPLFHSKNILEVFKELKRII